MAGKRNALPPPLQLTSCTASGGNWVEALKFGGEP